MLDLRQTDLMRVLVVGAGGVGAAFAAIAQRRAVFTQVVLADVALERAAAAAERLGEPDRFSAERVDASSREDLVELIGARPAGRGAERVRPALQRADLRARRSRRRSPIWTWR